MKIGDCVEVTYSRYFGIGVGDIGEIINIENFDFYGLALIVKFDKGYPPVLFFRSNEVKFVTPEKCLQLRLEQ